MKSPQQRAERAAEFEYEVLLRFGLANLAAPAKEIEDDLNAHFSTMGYDEKVKLGATVPLSLKVSREITAEEQTKITAMIEQQAAHLNGKVVAFRRKPGNVSQEAASAS